LFLGVIAAVLLGVNSVKRIMAFKATSQKVSQSETRLEKLRDENEKLKRELEYKKSKEFEEAEIRNKLGLAKPNEAIVVIPQESDNQEVIGNVRDVPNWRKWWRLFFRG